MSSIRVDGEACLEASGRYPASQLSERNNFTWNI